MINFLFNIYAIVHLRLSKCIKLCDTETRFVVYVSKKALPLDLNYLQINYELLILNHIFMKNLWYKMHLTLHWLVNIYASYYALGIMSTADTMKKVHPFILSGLTATALSLLSSLKLFFL